MEFYSRKFEAIDTVPLFGNNYSQLAGVVLFNYAFSITIPSWLNEKKDDVSVNAVVWSSTIVCTLIYVSFGVLAAMSFIEKPDNILIILASQKVSIVTRLCSVLFGVIIIGSGIPTYLIMIRNSLYHGGVCSSEMSLFIGAYLHFLFSWMLYQGSMLIGVLNWTGLIVNSLVAFIFPLVLSLVAFEKMATININELIGYQIIDNINHQHYEIELWEEKNGFMLVDTSYTEVVGSKVFIPLDDTDEPIGESDEFDYDPNLVINNSSSSNPFSLLLEHITTNIRLKYLYARTSFANIWIWITFIRIVLIFLIITLLLNFVFCSYYGLESTDSGEDLVSSAYISSYFFGGFNIKEVTN